MKTKEWYEIYDNCRAEGKDDDFCFAYAESMIEHPEDSELAEGMK